MEIRRNGHDFNGSTLWFFIGDVRVFVIAQNVALTVLSVFLSTRLIVVALMKYRSCKTVIVSES
jgi:hypothetical protein